MDDRFRLGCYQIVGSGDHPLVIWRKVIESNGVWTTDYVEDPSADLRTDFLVARVGGVAALTKGTIMAAALSTAVTGPFYAKGCSVWDQYWASLSPEKQTAIQSVPQVIALMDLEIFKEDLIDKLSRGALVLAGKAPSTPANGPYTRIEAQAAPYVHLGFVTNQGVPRHKGFATELTALRVFTPDEWEAVLSGRALPSPPALPPEGRRYSKNAPKPIPTAASQERRTLSVARVRDMMLAYVDKEIQSGVLPIATNAIAACRAEGASKRQAESSWANDVPDEHKRKRGQRNQISRTKSPAK